MATDRKQVPGSLSSKESSVEKKDDGSGSVKNYFVSSITLFVQCWADRYSARLPICR